MTYSNVVSGRPHNTATKNLACQIFLYFLATLTYRMTKCSLKLFFTYKLRTTSRVSALVLPLHTCSTQLEKGVVPAGRASRIPALQDQMQTRSLGSPGLHTNFTLGSTQDKVHLMSSVTDMDIFAFTHITPPPSDV